jgi:hypothetical protein
MCCYNTYRDSGTRSSTSNFFLIKSTPGPLIHTLHIIQIWFQIRGLFELMFDFPLHDAAGSQI